MLNLNEFQNRIRAVVLIGFGKYEQFKVLDISNRGFWQSFQALVASFIPFILQWALLVQGGLGEVAGLSPMQVVLRGIFIDISQWLVPLFIIVAIANTLAIKNRVILFVIAYNWLQAAILWCYAPIMALQLLVPDAGAVYALLLPVMFVFSTMISYRVFQLALGKTTGFMVPFFIIYLLLTLVVSLIGLKIVGWNFFFE